MCVCCTAGRLPTVLRNVRRVSRQDLESLVSKKSNGRITSYSGGTSLRKKHINDNDDNEALDSAPSKIASEATFSRATSDNDEFREKTFFAEKEIESSQLTAYDSIAKIVIRARNRV